MSSPPSIQTTRDSDATLDVENASNLSKEEGRDASLADIYDDPNFIEEDAIEGILADDSPYPEVRSAVSNIDDPTIPVSTLRSWVLGLFWAILVPGLNEFFYFRYPAVTIGGVVAQLLVFPLGCTWARIVPKWSIFGIQLNPGPFSIKEHVLVTIMATVGANSAYATDIVTVQRFYYEQNFSFAYRWMVVMSTQLIGFSIGGIARRYLVNPPSMIWPSNLVTCALFNTLHAQQYSGIGRRGGMTRERFFLVAFLCSCAWYFVPGYLFQALSYFSWVTWIAPDNVPINQMFGYVNGMGMSLVTFDWAQIAYIGSPLATPWWVEINVMIAFVLFYWILTPILYFTNTWNSMYMPISSRGSYDNTGNPYNISRIMTPDGLFDEVAYKAYSPLFMSTTFALGYALSFAGIAATVMHAILYFRKQIFAQTRRAMHEQPDIHARLMSRYPQVPWWWYSSVFVTMFIFGAVAIEVWDTKFPTSYFILALALAFVFVIPVGMIEAITNQQVGLNVISELIIGYAHPGRPVAMMLFKTWAYISMTQALNFTSDLKLGHYMKIPPRLMFFAQVIATVIAGTTQLGVQSWMFGHIADMCSVNQPNGFTCAQTEVFGTASIIWGAIGPARIFSKGQVYFALTFGFLVGFVAPLLAWVACKRWPHGWMKYIHFPVLFATADYIPPASAVNFVPWAIVGFLFQYVIRRRHFSWWMKYNYVLSAALDSGVAVGAVLIFFCLQYPKNGDIGNGFIYTWWGNKGAFETADGLGTPMKVLVNGRKFGPGVW